MEIKTTCPLGATCEIPKDGHVERCLWYTKIKGIDAQGVEHDEWGCSMAWLPVLLLESSNTNRSIAKAMEIDRIETTKRQDAMLTLIEQGKLNA